MFFEKPDYIPKEEWEDVVDRCVAAFSDETNGAPVDTFDPFHDPAHYALALAMWAAERASESAHRGHQHTDLLRFR